MLFVFPAKILLSILVCLSAYGESDFEPATKKSKFSNNLALDSDGELYGKDIEPIHETSVPLEPRKEIDEIHDSNNRILPSIRKFINESIQITETRFKFLAVGFDSVAKVARVFLTIASGRQSDTSKSGRIFNKEEGSQ